MTTTTQSATDASANTEDPMSTLRLEVVTLPVTDVDRAKNFYLELGWRLEADITIDAENRIVQITPPGSPASIQFGTGRTTAVPGSGSLQNLYLVVTDIEEARAELIAHGADVGEVWHREPGNMHASGPDPKGGSYNSFANFSDPDGNTWLLQQITQRLPGRVPMLDTEQLAQRLLETSLRHDPFDRAAPPHHWWDWYAAYMVAREQGAEPDDASGLANTYMAEVKGIVLPSAGE